MRSLIIFHIGLIVVNILSLCPSLVFALKSTQQIHLTGKKTFKPKSFTLDEFQTLDNLTAAIMPSGEFPGAREAKVAEFIDLQILYDHELQNRFRVGLNWIDQMSRRQYHRRFRELNDQQKREVLDRLRYKSLYQPGEEKGREFYRLARRYTEMGFYSSEAGLKVLKAPVDISPAAKGVRRL